MNPSPFHPLIDRWFGRHVGIPTDVQAEAWAHISAGEHVLISAPTGSGKTLAAFLWALNQLITGKWITGHTSVLYISPLRALNNDVQRNLLAPLDGLRRAFESEGEYFPAIRVLTRSGDTPQPDRRRMLRHPPEILITTPESLNLLLSSAGGRSILTGLSTVILDEIHAVFANKRGVHLITAVERLVRLAGEFQRIALSATIRPLESVAEFVGGFRINGDPGHPRYVPRPVVVVRTELKRRHEIIVRFPEKAAQPRSQETFWDPFVEAFRDVILRNRSTLLFVNSRRLCEKLTLMINQGEERPLAYAHHGSLSREIREEVERKLKAGDLRAIVATNSLELGIDIGDLDEVVLIQSPPSISSAIQRVGRAGHRVGGISRGILYPTHAWDFLEAAVLATGIVNEDIEKAKPVLCPLDVLAQVIVSMVGVETWDIDALYGQLCASYPYRHLSRDQYDLVLNMLAGRYAATRIRELRPRISVDRIDRTVSARKGALLALYTSGGTIPDRGYFHLRHHETGAMIGELDEEFVWEATTGQIFALGSQSWRIERITHNDVLVRPGPPTSMATPFWRGEENGRDFHFSTRIARFLEDANTRLDDPDFPESLRRDHRMEPASACRLIALLRDQRAATHCDLPHRHHLVVETVLSGPGSAPGNQVILHTVWGGRVNRPFAMALSAAWEARFGHRLDIHVGNDCVALQLPHELPGEELLSLVTSANVDRLLRKRLEGSGFFGARFRECAGRALLLGRNRFRERMPLWMSRVRSKKLLDAVMQFDDFPIMLEAWRACLQDEFDMGGLRRVLAELESGVIRWSETRTHAPSPMAQSMSWAQVNHYMYLGDELPSGKSSSLREDLLRQAVYQPGLRPTVARDLVSRFELKLKRLSPGYSPSTPEDLLDWVKERCLIPASEWGDLLEAARRDLGAEPETLAGPIAAKLVRLSHSAAAEPMICALETMPWIAGAFPGVIREATVEPLAPAGASRLREAITAAPQEEEPGELLSSLLAQWLQFYGPTTAEFVRKSLGIDGRRLCSALEDLLASQKIISGRLITGGDEEQICDAENFEMLLRLSRRETLPAVEPLEIEYLPLFLAQIQGLSQPEADRDGLCRRMEQLLCFSARAGMWESEILPARMRSYDPSWLDTIMQEWDLRWVGGGNHRVAFCFEADLDLLLGARETGARDGLEGPEEVERREEETPSDNGPTPAGLLQDELGRYDFPALLQITGLGPVELAERLWEEVWRGRITNDTFIALRKGIENRFRMPGPAEAPRRKRWGRAARRASFARRKGAMPMAGNWFRLKRPPSPDDLIEAEERNKDRARLLLDRYGILFRELLLRELPPFQWPCVFRSLRLMELSGEVMTGFFFHGIPGPQFISHQALGSLQRGLPEDAVYWLNAADPASLCGVPLDSIRGQLPRRLDHTHLVYRGKELVMVSERHGRALTFRAAPDDPDLQTFMAPLHHLLMRRFQPLRRITVETVNGEAAAFSPYLDALRVSFEIVIDHRRVTLYRRADSWMER